MNQCPIDRHECTYAWCETECQKMYRPDEPNYTAEAGEIGRGLGWLGFWIALGIVVAAALPYLK